MLIMMLMVRMMPKPTARINTSRSCMATATAEVLVKNTEAKENSANQ
jgi:hypothetical protein